MKNIEKTLKEATATEAFGLNLGQALQPGDTLFLQGQLGAGKTTFVRGILQGLGHTGKVKSPTYTLVEPYQLKNGMVFHFDLYRLNQAAELIDIGIDEYFSPTAICLIEWPEKGEGYLPHPDLCATLCLQQTWRELQLTAQTPRGESILQYLRGRA